MFELFLVLFFKQKTAYEMRISDWSSDVCSSDLVGVSMRTARLLIAFAAVLPSCTPPATAAPDAFPGAEGFGRKAQGGRSEERRVGNGGVSTCSSRRSPQH